MLLLEDGLVFGGGDVLALVLRVRRVSTVLVLAVFRAIGLLLRVVPRRPGEFRRHGGEALVPCPQSCGPDVTQTIDPTTGE